MKTSNIILIIVGLLTFGSCTDLDENVYSEIPIENFFKNEKELVANAGRAYTKLQGYCGEQSLWTLLLLASDEASVPVHGGHNYDNGRYEDLQINVIRPSNKLILKGWQWIFNGIASCNEVIYETELSTIEFDGKDKILAELKILRAYLYYCAIDSWANVPFSIDYTDVDYPEQKDRAFIFDFIVKEINDNINFLDKTPSEKNYGRITKDAARTILAKLYLNSDVWFNKPMWKEAENVCKEIINDGNFIIEDVYDTNFDIDNDKSKENIFVILYDNIYTSTGSSSTSFYLHTLTLEPASMATFNISYNPWAIILCQPDFFQLYEENDLRRSATWLYGQQYDINGKILEGVVYNPIFDEEYFFIDSGGRQKYDGARCWKWHYQTDGSLTSYKTSMDNDFALFRYADVVLMYVETLIRQGRAAEAVNLSDFQKIRTRAGLNPYTVEELTLEEIYQERGRELAWEGTRHQDMIRFDKYLDKSWAHPKQTEKFRLLFPIPTDVLNSNPKLVQNTGY